MCCVTTSSGREKPRIALCLRVAHALPRDPAPPITGDRRPNPGPVLRGGCARSGADAAEVPSP
jgi:hypothetical protein